VVSVEVEVESDRMRASLGEHEGRAGDKEENDEICRMRSDGPAQEVIKVEVSGVEVEVMAGMRDVVTLPTFGRPVCPVLAAAVESRLLHKTAPPAPSCG
jgi:hypothetical protein